MKKVELIYIKDTGKIYATHEFESNKYYDDEIWIDVESYSQSFHGVCNPEDFYIIIYIDGKVSRLILKGMKRD